MALELAEMNSFLQKRQMEESRVQLEIQNGFKDLSRSVIPNGAILLSIISFSLQATGG